MDSRQIYRGMDVGTDKVSLADRARVPHFGLDLLDPDTAYSAGRFGRDARRWIASIRARRRVPILVGGTGFFLRAITHPIFEEPDLDPERRAALRGFLAERSIEELTRWVERLDPERAQIATEGGPQRLGRTLEVALLSGRPLSWWHRNAEPDAEPLQGVTIFLDLPREALDRNISGRAQRMMERGLLAEVEALLAAGYRADDPGMTGTGYREVVAYLEGRTTLEEALEEIVRRTRQYARRQLTWCRNQLPADAVKIDATRPIEEQLDCVVRLWSTPKEGGCE